MLIRGIYYHRDDDIMQLQNDVISDI